METPPNNFEVSPQPSPALEILEEWVEADSSLSLLNAALGFEGLAMLAETDQDARKFMDRSEDLLKVIDAREAPSQPYLSIYGLVARAHLNLMPISRNITVDGKLSTFATLEAAHNTFLGDLLLAVKQSEKLFERPEPLGSEERQQYAKLAAFFNQMAFIGLFQYAEMHEFKQISRIILPAFLEPDLITTDEPNWDANSFVESDDGVVEQDFRYYVRLSEKSPLRRLADKNIVLVWISDLKFFNEKNFSAFTIIRELADETANHAKLGMRTRRLFEAIEKRTVGNFEIKK